MKTRFKIIFYLAFIRENAVAAETFKDKFVRLLNLLLQIEFKP